MSYLKKWSIFCILIITIKIRQFINTNIEDILLFNNQKNQIWGLKDLEKNVIIILLNEKNFQY